MKLKKLFSNVIFLRIIVTILIIFLSYAVVKKNQYESLAFQTSYETLDQAMKEVRAMERLSKVMVNRKNNDVNTVDFYAIEDLLDLSKATEDILEINSYRYSWREMRRINYNIRIILSEEAFNNKKLDYLKAISVYLEEILDLYEENISQDIDVYNQRILGENKFFKDYKSFMLKVDQLISEEKIRSLRYY